MLYSLQPNVSPPIYHRPPQSYPAEVEVQQLSKQNSANYVKKLRPPTQNWLPYQSEEPGQAKVVRYNVRKPSKYAAKYPKYPQYLPTTVLRLKSVKPNAYPSPGGYPSGGNYQAGGKMNAYPVPIKANYAIKNIYSQPVIYEQLDYQTSSYAPSPKYPPAPNYSPVPNYPAGYPTKSPPQPSTYQQPQPVYQQSPPSGQQYPPKPAKTTVAAYIPVLQVPAIEQPPMQKPKMEALPRLNLKKPLANYEEKIIEEHVYQIPNHMLHEVRHEVHGQPKPLNGLYLIAQPAPAYQPVYRPRPISQAVSHMHQSFGTHYLQHGRPHVLPEMPKPQISYDTSYKPADGPPVVEMPYQMDNYAKAEDAGLFKPLLERTRQLNQFPKVGAVPYKDNDPVGISFMDFPRLPFFKTHQLFPFAP